MAVYQDRSDHHDYRIETIALTECIRAALDSLKSLHLGKTIALNVSHCCGDNNALWHIVL